ncbi:hypothetical protein HU200_056033 [Digitaria exilis]|uniref:Uncharacterized protein n=1 Tax=Digitaria exilis TaxID=1010633 RepID=A0A835E3Z5_9POAL|nr:hypothetical protein HU200_056033 [Digitaria exilis]
MATGFLVMLFGASVGITFSDATGSLLSFAGVLTAANLIAAGVLVPDGPAAFERALAAFVRRHVTVVGLAMASCAVTAVSGEAGSVLCFGIFALLLFGLGLINIGVVVGQ